MFLPKDLNNRLTVMELTIKDTYKLLKEINDKIDSLNTVTKFEHTQPVIGNPHTPEYK
jgi:hypothetical protein